MDFNKELNEAVETIVKEKLPALIEEKATKMVEDIVQDLFRWGKVRDQIKGKIEESINVNLQKFDLIDYNAIIAKTINENLVEQINLKPILDMTQDIIGFVNKKTISLEEIAQMYIDESMEENEGDYSGSITFIVEENTQYGWVTVCADVEPNKKNHECSHEFVFSTKKHSEGQIFSFKTNDKYYSNERKSISPSKYVSMRGLEGKIFRLYSAQVKITDYDREPDVYWNRDN